MHPAYSVIFFTTASGAGYGLLAWLGLGATFGLIDADFWLGFVGLGLAFALVTAGLLSSTFHLGHLERAWRAFSQWRSSWLSREGVMAVATYVPAGLFAIGWVFFANTDGAFAVLGLLAAICAIVTVGTTAMIYASLKPIAQWHSRYTLPAYLLFSVMTGATLACALLATFATVPGVALIGALALTVAGWALKRMIWRHNDGIVPTSTASSATGLEGGTVRSVEWPHTEANYLLKEMGHRVARKHAERLRQIAQLLAFFLPIVLLLAALAMSGVAAALLTWSAAIAQLAGMLVERWLFFAEAKHTVTLYYHGD